MLLTRAGELDGTGRTEDELAYLRDEREFRNVHLVEQPRGDFGFEMARMLWFSAYQCGLYAALVASSDETLSGVAVKAVKEVDYHRDHASHWVLRLGDGTAESHERMQAGLERVAPYVAELFEDDAVSVAAAEAGAGVLPSSLWPAASAVRRAGRRRGHPGAARGADVALAWWPRRHPLPPDGLPARRDAAHRPLPPRSDLVTPAVLARRHRGAGRRSGCRRLDATALRAAIAAVPDPEVPVITIEDLGILRDVTVDEATGTVAGRRSRRPTAAARPWTRSRRRVEHVARRERLERRP